MPTLESGSVTTTDGTENTVIDWTRVSHIRLVDKVIEVHETGNAGDATIKVYRSSMNKNTDPVNATLTTNQIQVGADQTLTQNTTDAYRVAEFCEFIKVTVTRVTANVTVEARLVSARAGAQGP